MSEPERKVHFENVPSSALQQQAIHDLRNALTVINAHAQLVSRRLACARQIDAQSVSDSLATVSKASMEAERSLNDLDFKAPPNNSR